MIGIIVSFVLLGVATPSSNSVDARSKAKEEQITKEKEEAEQRVRAEQEVVEQQVQAQSQVNGQVESGITGYCKDGALASGDPSARGKANSCYSHGGWAR